MGKARSLTGTGHEFFSKLHVSGLKENLFRGICQCLGRLHQKDVSLEKTEREEHFYSPREQLKKAQNWGWETWA